MVTPVGVQVAVGETHPIIRYAWQLYAGQAVINCSTGTPPPVTDPSLSKWNPAYKLGGTNTYTPGSTYGVYVIPSEAGIPGTGKTIVRIEAYNLPTWITNYKTYPTGEFGLENTAPVGAGPQIIRLVLTDSTGAKVIQEFIITPVSQDVYALIQDEAGIGFRVRVGSNSGTTLPRVKIVQAPAGWSDYSQYELTPWGALIDTVNYYYQYTNYGTGPSGDYVFEIVHFGQTKYATFTRTGANRSEVPTLSNTPPTLAAKAITSFTINASRLSTDRKATLNITASGPVRVRILGTNGLSYNSGFVNATQLQQVSPGRYTYEYVGNDVLPAGTYNRYVELIEDNSVNVGENFSVTDSSGGITTYTLGNLYEGTPIASVDSVTRAIYRRQNGNYSPPRLVNISARTASLATMQVAYRMNNSSTALTDSDWTDMTTTGTFQDTNQSATKTYLSTDTSLTVYLRPKSSPLAIVRFTVALPGEESTYTVATLLT